MRSFIIIAGLSTKCTCLCKKKNHWVFDTDISAGFFIANQFANQFSINARKHLKLLNSIFSINVKTDLILLKLVLLLCSVVKSLNEYIM